jgi:hypothetical protein
MVAGLWHGASLNFLLWGLFMGSLVVVTRRLSRRGWSVQRHLAILLTYLGAVVGGVFFRLPEMEDIGSVFAALLGFHGVGAAPILPTLFAAVVIVYPFLTPEEWSWRPETWRGPRLLAAAGVGALVGLAFIWMLAPPRPFVYFQF